MAQMCWLDKANSPSLLVFFLCVWKALCLCALLCFFLLFFFGLLSLSLSLFLVQSPPVFLCVCLFGGGGGGRWCNQSRGYHWFGRRRWLRCSGWPKFPLHFCFVPSFSLLVAFSGFYKAKGCLCSCVCASRSWGTNALKKQGNNNHAIAGLFNVVSGR